MGKNKRSRFGGPKNNIKYNGGVIKRPKFPIDEDLIRRQQEAPRPKEIPPINKVQSCQK